MKITSTILVGVTIIFFLSTQKVGSVATSTATESPKPIVVPKPKSVDELIHEKATKYNVSEKEMVRIIACENQNRIPTLQSGHYYKEGNRWGFSTSTREKSFGLVQIHLPDHPEVTYEQATDPEYSIEFLARYLSQGKGGQWTCY